MKYTVRNQGNTSTSCLNIQLERNEKIDNVIKELVSKHHQEKISNAYVTKGKNSYIYTINHYFYRRENSLVWKNALTGESYDLRIVKEQEVFKRIIELLDIGVPEQHDLSEEQVKRYLELNRYKNKEQNLLNNIQRLEWEQERIASELSQQKAEYKKILHKRIALSNQLKQP